MDSSETDEVLPGKGRSFDTSESKLHANTINSSDSSPQAEVQSSPQAAAQLAKLLAGFDGAIVPNKVSFGYRVGIALATCIMILLPLIYLLMIGLIVYAMYSLFEDRFTQGISSDRLFKPRCLALGLSLLLASPLLVLMLKPFFARRSGHLEPRKLLPEHEPVLFAFVERICREVNAPVPSTILVDIEPNASAGMRRGFFRFSKNELLLTIGLPLVASMSTQELAGVLAHEFGHFSQGAGMRLSFLTRYINAWFTRVVHKRDVIDVILAQATREFHLSSFGLVFIVVVVLLRVLIVLVRAVLWCLMMIGHIVSGNLMRQMEFDADRYEVRMVGTDTFTKTQWRLNLLQVSQRSAFMDVNDFQQDGRLPDNLPRLIDHNISLIPEPVRDKLRRALYEEKTSLFDTHPCDGARLANAASENTSGIFHNEAPASQLFSNFESLAKLATTEFYKEIFQSKFDPSRIRDTSKLLNLQSKETENLKGLQRYCLNQFTGICSVLLPYWQLGKKLPAQPKRTIETLRHQSMELQPQYSEQYEQFIGSRRRFIGNQKKAANIRAGFHVGLIKSAADAHREESHKANNEYRNIQTIWNSLQPFRGTLGKRLMVDLELLRNPKVLERIGREPEVVKKVDLLLSVAKVIQQQHSVLETLHTNFRKLEALLENNRAEIASDEYREFVISMQHIDLSLRSIWSAFSDTLYPFKHGDGKISVSRFLLKVLPNAHDPGEVYDAAGGVLGKVQHLNARIFGRLTELAEAVERALGFEPLVEYQEKILDDEEEVI